MRASSVEHSNLGETLTSGTPAISALFSDGTSHLTVQFFENQSSDVSCQEPGESGEWSSCVFGTSKFGRSDIWSKKRNQMTLVQSQEKVEHEEIGSVNSAQTAKTANSTHTFNIFSEQSSDEELSLCLCE